MQFFPSLLFGISASLDALLVGISYGLRGIHIRALQNLFISFVSLLGTCLSVCLGSSLMIFLPVSLTDRAGSVILMLLGTYYIAKWTFGTLTSRRMHPAEIRQSTDTMQSMDPKQSMDIKHSTDTSHSTDMKHSTDTRHSTDMKHSMNMEHSTDTRHSGNTAITSAEKTSLKLTSGETLVLSLTLSVNNIGIGLSASMAGLLLLPAAVMTFICSALFLFSGNRLGRSSFLRLIGYAADPLSGLLLIGLGIIQMLF